MNCPQCGFRVDKDMFVAITESTEFIFRPLSYSEYMKRKNIYIWIKDRR